VRLLEAEVRFMTEALGAHRAVLSIELGTGRHAA
jgi:hypothetical protein